MIAQQSFLKQNRLQTLSQSKEKPVVHYSQPTPSQKSHKNSAPKRFHLQDPFSTKSTLLKHSLFKAFSPGKFAKNKIKDSILSAVNSHRLRESLKKMVKKKPATPKHFSPLKKLKNYRFLGETPRTSVSHDLSSNLNYQQKLQMNCFQKGELSFYTNKISLSQVIRKILFEGYRCEDVVEFAFHSFKKLDSLRRFLEVMVKESKIFAATVKQSLFRVISKVFDEEKEFPFTKNMRHLNRAVSEIKECLKFLENTNYEVEKLTLSYLKNNSSPSEEEIQEVLCLSKKLFVESVFQDPLVKNFFSQLKNFYQDSHFYMTRNKAHFQAFNNFLDLLYFEDEDDQDSQSNENDEDMNRNSQSVCFHQLQSEGGISREQN